MWNSSGHLRHWPAGDALVSSVLARFCVRRCEESACRNEYLACPRTLISDGSHLCVEYEQGWYYIVVATASHRAHLDGHSIVSCIASTSKAVDVFEDFIVFSIWSGQRVYGMHPNHLRCFRPDSVGIPGILCRVRCRIQVFVVIKLCFYPGTCDYKSSSWIIKIPLPSEG